MRRTGSQSCEITCRASEGCTRRAQRVIQDGAQASAKYDIVIVMRGSSALLLALLLAVPLAVPLVPDLARASSTSSDTPRVELVTYRQKLATLARRVAALKRRIRRHGRRRCGRPLLPPRNVTGTLHYQFSGLTLFSTPAPNKPRIYRVGPLRLRRLGP